METNIRPIRPTKIEFETEKEMNEFIEYALSTDSAMSPEMIRMREMLRNHRRSKRRGQKEEDIDPNTLVVIAEWKSQINEILKRIKQLQQEKIDNNESTSFADGMRVGFANTLYLFEECEDKYRRNESK